MDQVESSFKEQLKETEAMFQALLKERLDEFQEIVSDIQASRQENQKLHEELATDITDLKDAIKTSEEQIRRVFHD